MKSIKAFPLKTLAKTLALPPQSALYRLGKQSYPRGGQFCRIS
jgi:hypothetical protein